MLRPYKPAWKKVCCPELAPYIWRRVEAVVRRGQWAYGAQAGYLERAIARALEIDPEQVIATTNCTVALAAAARGLNWEKSWEDLPDAPALTYPGSYSWSRSPRLAECDEEGWPLEDVGVGVDLWGRPFPRRCLILDAAHRVLAPEHGPYLRDGKLRAVCYSFGPLKELPSFAGGALVWHSPDTERLRRWLNNCRDGRGPHADWIGGVGGLMHEPHAAMVLGQIARAHILRRRRASVLKVYHKYLGNLMMTRPDECSGHLAVMRAVDVGHVKLIRSRLDSHKIEWSCHYDVPEEYPRAHALSKRIITIPCHTRVTSRQAEKIARIIAAS